MRKMKMRSIAGLTVLLTAALSASTIAYAETTTEIRVVNGLAQGSEFEPLNPDSGWYAETQGTGAVEIGSAYGAPQGFGTDAVMFDTPNAGDRAFITALTDQPYSPFGPAFPGYIRTTPDLHLGFWLYLDDGSTAGPVIDAYLAHWGAHSIITFDPIANGYTARDTWMYVDATAAGAIWRVRPQRDIERVDPADVVEMTWPDLIEHYKTSDEWYGAFDYGLRLLQYEPGTSAIDGITVTNGTSTEWVEGTRIDTLWSLVTDFELTPTHGRPMLDDCKNDGWRAHPTGPFRNQGQCIATIVANR
jgi:hypothetical protein